MFNCTVIHYLLALEFLMFIHLRDRSQMKLKFPVQNYCVSAMTLLCKKTKIFETEFELTVHRTNIAVAGVVSTSCFLYSVVNIHVTDSIRVTNSPMMTSLN
jgi:hypothetical protein